jgi:streptogramin lyase
MQRHVRKAGAMWYCHLSGNVLYSVNSGRWMLPQELPPPPDPRRGIASQCVQNLLTSETWRKGTSAT